MVQISHLDTHPNKLVMLDFFADGGSVTSSALRRYNTQRQRPLKNKVKGYEPYTAPGPAVGGFLVQSMLRLISRLDEV